MQIITPDWLTELRTELFHTEQALEKAQRHPPGERFEELYTQYIQGCESCVDWINERYTSVPDLIEFMKSDIEARARPYGIAMDKYLAWETRPYAMPPGQEAAGTVQMLRSIVDIVYPDAENHLNRCVEHIQSRQGKLSGPAGPQ